ncbi:MAG: ABC transporter permease, partial [Rhodobacterales bacterium]
MPVFLIRRVLTMVLTALCLTFVVFYLTNLPPNLEKLAKSEASSRMSDADVESWIERNGYGRPVLVRYGEWLGITPGWTRTEDGVTTGRCIERGQDPATAPLRCGILQGDWGFSTVFKQPVSQIIAERLGATGLLMLWVMIVMVPASLLIGVLSGMREGSRLDRGLSVFSIASTATPEYVSGVVLIALFASSSTGLSPWLAEQGWISGKTLFMGTATSALDSGITFWNFGLPVMTIALYGIGYIARMTRASMTEVMTAQYIRTARLKGVS